MSASLQGNIDRTENKAKPLFSWSLHSVRCRQKKTTKLVIQHIFSKRKIKQNKEIGKARNSMDRGIVILYTVDREGIK